uniref:Uncharacterized protein n=1 Tax=Eutreptiella gymnastica TaxID=73025 RepID=A0A7S1NR94_9EUGL
MATSTFDQMFVFLWCLRQRGDCSMCLFDTLEGAVVSLQCQKGPHTNGIMLSPQDLLPGKAHSEPVLLELKNRPIKVIRGTNLTSCHNLGRYNLTLHKFTFLLGLLPLNPTPSLPFF